MAYSLRMGSGKRIATEKVFLEFCVLVCLWKKSRKSTSFCFFVFFFPSSRNKKGKKEKKKTVVHLVHNKIIMSFILSIKEYIKQNKVFT